MLVSDSVCFSLIVNCYQVYIHKLFLFNYTRFHVSYHSSTSTFTTALTFYCETNLKDIWLDFGAKSRFLKKLVEEYL